MFRVAFLKTWDQQIHTSKLSLYADPMTPIMGNPAFPPGMEVVTFLCWRGGYPSPLLQAYGNGEFMPVVDLIGGLETRPGTWLQYLQLRAFCRGLESGGSFA